MNLAISSDSYKKKKKMQKLTDWWRTIHLLAEFLDLLKNPLMTPSFITEIPA